MENNQLNTMYSFNKRDPQLPLDCLPDFLLPLQVHQDAQTHVLKQQTLPSSAHRDLPDLRYW